MASTYYLNPILFSVQALPGFSVQSGFDLECAEITWFTLSL